MRFLQDRRRRYLVCSAMLAVLAGALGARAAGSGASQFAREVTDRVRSASVRTYPVLAASDSLRAAVERGEIGADNVVMVIVESMGELRDSALRAYVWEPIEAAPIKQRYRSVRGVVPFRGGTTSGELRELCGIFADYITLPWSALPRCLPRRLHARGFDTFALHGYKESYYNRERWYPALFEKSHFESALDDDAPERRCGTQFRGICDRDAFIVLRRLARDRHRFIYWMTLDAHTPVDVARMREFRADWQAGGLDQRAICRTAAAVCLQALFWRDMLRQLAGLALDAQLPPTRFLIVGDHAPAFVRRDRAMGYIFGVVPYLELSPRR